MTASNNPIIQSSNHPLHGWLILDKPEGITSAKAVAIVKKLTGADKAGHAGTLDPFASGVLPIALGEATKTVQFCTDYAKQYRFTAVFGESRDTDDREGKVVNSGGRIPKDAEILAAIPGFIGEIMQTPPEYSAIKINGKRAYDLARKGENPEMKPRRVRVNSLELLSYNLENRHSREGGNLYISSTNCQRDPRLRGDDNRRGGDDKNRIGDDKIEGFEFRMHCGKGVYVRAIARDLALKLGTYAYVSELRREAVGKFSEANAISLEVLEKLVHIPPPGNDLPDYLLPAESALDDIPVLELAAESALKLRQGQAVLIANSPDRKNLRVKSAGKLVAIGEVRSEILRPVRVFNF